MQPASHTQKSSENCLCAGCDKKETGCTRASAADTLDIHQVGNWVLGVFKFGRMDLIFIDARVKVIGAYYREVLLTQKLLPVMCEICGKFFNLPARQCSCSRAWDNQPSETRHLRSFYQTFCHPIA